MTYQRLLIANRGEVAARIAHTASDQGWSTVAIHTADDASGLHLRRADAVVQLPGRGVAGYLDGAAVIAAAQSKQCDAVHPGWGFLAESAEFARACQAADLHFVGPDVEQLRLFGDKLAARDLAERCEVPTLAGSLALKDAYGLRQFREALGASAEVIIKASAGGGGRGMQIVRNGDDADASLSRASAEALAAFGDGTVYAERFVPRARHIEVQVVGGADGQVTHLWERDCSLQRRHQKLIEMAPAPALSDELRHRLIGAAIRMGSEVRFRSLGTFEFLVDLSSGDFFFIEANPRLQVEHPVTEAVLGLDLVALQLAIANGARLSDLGLENGPQAPRGAAVQLRVNAETMRDDGSVRFNAGRLSRFESAPGAGIRMDTAVSGGDMVSPAFDSLLAKLIVHSPAATIDHALARAGRAAAELRVEGVETNLSFLRAVLARPDVAAGDLHTQLIDTHWADLVGQSAGYAMETVSWGRPEAGPESRVLVAPAGADVISAPMPSSVVSIDISAGETVRRGQSLVVLEAMKMHHVVEAPVPGVVLDIPVDAGSILAEGDPIVIFQPSTDIEDAPREAESIDLDRPRADLNEVRLRHTFGLDSNRPDAVAKRRRIAARTARENVDDLCDPDSFIEYGALAIAAQRRRRTLEDLMERTPADGMVAGVGTVNEALFGPEAARCAVLAYDYTVLAGTQGHVNHKKKDRMFELAREWKLPVVFFTEGGGGRPGDVDTDDLIMSWLDITTFTAWPRLSGMAPRIAVNSGRCFAGNAVIFGCADITIATRSSNIGLAGPAMIEGGGLGSFTPEEIGPIDVQTKNGVVDLACADEAQATALARELLGYFQGVKPEWEAPDQRLLRHVIPENRLRIYDIREVIDALGDRGSVTELRREYGIGVVTAFVRVEGRPFGLIANDPRHLGGALDGDGSEKGARFLQLCDTYGIPVISLCDTPGFMVGPESEKTAAVRRGSRLIMASANLSVPLFTVVLRKAYGLGAQAMAGGGLHEPFFSIAWPTAEFGPMGLEGAVELGFRKELDAVSDPGDQKALYDKLVQQMYEKGKGVSVAQTFEVDAVIDPADTRQWLLRGLRSTAGVKRERRRYVDVW